MRPWSRGEVGTFRYKLAFALRRPDMVYQRLRGRPLLEIPLDRIESALGGPPAVVLEAGCHDGGDTLAMARRWPTAVVYGTEPIDDSRASARAVCAGHERVSIEGFALSDAGGVATMRVSSREGRREATASSSLLPDGLHTVAFPEVRFDHQVDVICRTLDDWFSGLGLSRIDLLWLDLQGMELRVLAASKLALPATRAIHLEVSQQELFEGSGTFRDLDEFLSSTGFHIAVDRVGPVFGNVLYVRD